MIKIVFNEKRIWLTQDYKPMLQEYKNAFIVFSNQKDKIKECLDLLMLSEIQHVIIVGDEQSNLEIICESLKFLKAGGGIVMSDSQELLFIYRHGKWDLPKGKLEKGETIDVCALREVEEETGVQNLEIIELLMCTYHIYIEDTYILKETTWFLMKTKHQQLAPQKEEGITKAVWVHQNKIEKQLESTYESVKDIFKELSL
jgi:ADP-ribose pyrophosphatase YjhB (NUDIX family)